MTMTRRTALSAAVAAATIAAAPASASIIAAPPVSVSSNAWNKALAEYQRAQAEHDRLWAAFNDAEERCGKACPRVDHYFDEYKLGMGMKRETVLMNLTVELSRQRAKAFALLDEAGKREACLQIRADCERIADEFMAYQARDRATQERCRIDDLNEVAAEFGERHYFPARERLMETPAPDTAALLVKMGIAAQSGDEDHMERCHADAVRLLA